MRLPNTRRGAHPRYRSQGDLSRAWFLDETTGDYSPSVWGSTIQNLGPHNGGAFVTSPIVPYIVDSPVGMAKRFVGADVTAVSTDSANPDTDSQSVLTTQDATFSVWMYVEDITDFSVVVRFSGDGAGATAADNIPLRFAILNGSGKIEVNTQDGIKDTSTWRSDYELPLNRWVYVCIVRSPSGGAQINQALYVNGRFIENLTLQGGSTGNTPTGGSNAYWHVGGQYNSSGGGSIQLPFTGRLAGIYLWDRQLTADEMEEDYRRGLLLPFHTSSQVRVAVEKPEPAPGTTSLYYDATQLDGLDFVSELNTSNSPDNACVQGSVKFLREQENLSLAYLKNDTKLNLVEPTSYGSVERFLDVYRQIRIFAATVPLGLDASGDDYWYMLDGRIDLIDWGTEEVTVNFRDKGGLLVDTFIEDDVGYGTTPSGPPVIVDAVIDGIVTDNASPAKTGSYENPGAVIYDPPPGAAWAVNFKVQKREPVLVAIRTIAGEFGHDVKFRWYEPSESFRLQLYQPERDSVTLSSIFSPSEIKSISKAELASQRVRNVVRVSYDSAETDGEQNTNVSSITLPSGITLAGRSVNGDAGLNPTTGEATERTPAFVELENVSSINKYGRRFMEVQEESVSNINLGTEATRMASSMIQDLSDPEFDHSITVPLVPFLDIHDIIGFQPNAYLYSADQYLAVSQITHNFTEEATTTMSVRGQPNLGVRRWMTLESRGAPIPSNAPQEASTPLTKSEKLASLQSVLDKSQMNLGGKFTQVRNNAFMTWSNGNLNAPTSWSATNTWDNTNILSSATSKTGALSVEIVTTGYGIQSDLIPIDGYINKPYAIEFTFQADNTSTGITIGVEFFKANGDSIGTTAIAASLAPQAAATWETQRAYFAPLEDVSNDARYARIIVGKGAPAGSVYLDNVSLYPAAASCNVSYNTGTSFTTRLGLSTTNIKNIAYNVDTPSPEFYDYGDNVAFDEIAGTIPGSYFQVEESGIYEVAAKCAFDITADVGTGITAGDTLPVVMYIFADAEYTATTGLYTGAGSPRLVATQTTSFVLQTIGVGTNQQVTTMATVYVQGHFSYGEKISVAFGVDPNAIASAGLKGTASINPIDRCTTVLTTQYSSLTVKQRLLD